MMLSVRRNLRPAVHVALVSAGLAAIVVSGAAQARGQGQAAGAAPQGGGVTAAGTSVGNNVTGGKAAFIDASDMRMSRLQFEAGARTRWHVHTAPQLLLVEKGKGRMQEEGSPIRDLLVGQPVLTRPNVPHWHGAAPDQGAIHFTTYTGTLEWRDEVTDAQYLGRSR